MAFGVVYDDAGGVVGWVYALACLGTNARRGAVSSVRKRMTDQAQRYKEGKSVPVFLHEHSPHPIGLFCSSCCQLSDHRANSLKGSRKDDTTCWDKEKVTHPLFVGCFLCWWWRWCGC